MWVFGFSGGEWFIVAFVTVAVVSARYWPAFGERIAVRLSGGGTAPGSGANQDSPPRE
jgi:hypothetical protein